MHTSPPCRFQLQRQQAPGSSFPGNLPACLLLLLRSAPLHQKQQQQLARCLARGRGAAVLLLGQPSLSPIPALSALLGNAVRSRLHAGLPSGYRLYRMCLSKQNYFSTFLSLSPLPHRLCPLLSSPPPKDFQGDRLKDF